jgi:hypothetical protein
MARLVITLAACLAATAALTAVGNASEDATTAFLCPKNPAASPPTRWVKNYPPGGYRGSTWCNDGATAALTLKANPAHPKVPGSLSFAGGLCTQTKDGSRYLQIGTRISPASKRKPTDPKGLFLNKPTTNTGGGKWLDFGTPTFRWADPVKITWSGLKGTYSGTSGMWIGDTFTEVTVKGSFTCARIVKTTL